MLLDASYPLPVKTRAPRVATQAVLSDLGPIPPESQPGERALWVAALINPLPGLGVAIECRPALLTARSSAERLRVVTRVIEQSIETLRAGDHAVLMNASI